MDNSLLPDKGRSDHTIHGTMNYNKFACHHQKNQKIYCWDETVDLEKKLSTLRLIL